MCSHYFPEDNRVRIVYVAYSQHLKDVKYGTVLFYFLLTSQVLWIYCFIVSTKCRIFRSYGNV